MDSRTLAYPRLNDGTGGLDLLAAPALDSVFWPAERLGAPSGWWQHVPFAHWIMCNVRPRLLVELGTHAGVSYSAFCQAVARSNLDTRCFAVDTWRGDAHAGHYGEEVFEEFRRFHDERFGAFSALLRTSFNEALGHFSDESVDILHIDGCHTYEAVRHDFESWKPKLSRRATVLFHDVNERNGDFGAWRLWSELCAHFPHFEFLHGHGLGVLAVGDNVPDVIARLCGLSDPALVARIRDRFSLIGDRWECVAQEKALMQDLKSAKEQTLQLLQIEIPKLYQQLQTRDQQLRSFQQQLEQAQGCNKKVVEELSSRQMEVEQAQVRFVAAEQELVSNSHFMHALREQLALERKTHASALIEAHAEAERLRLELATATAHTELIQAELRSILNSTSWKVTYPVRRLLQKHVAARQWLRHSLTIAWWTATGQVGRRVRQRRRESVPQKSRHKSTEMADHACDKGSIVAPQSILPTSPKYSLGERWYDEEAPEVSIVVLNYNKSALTVACLESIWQFTTEVRYEILVLDNGSGLGEYDRLGQLDGPFRVIRLEVNRYFGEGNNIAVEHARGELICFLNNDTVVTSGWLVNLVGPLRADQQIGAVGPKFVYPDGRLQEAGALLMPDGTVRQIGKGGDPADPQYDVDKAVHYVSAACLLMPRKLFIELGGFDLVYEPAYYEDLDLCFKLRERGRIIWYCHSATVIHHENTSQREVSEIVSLIETNRLTFLNRWRYRLAYPTLKTHDCVTMARDNHAMVGKVVIYMTYGLMLGGGERFLLSLADHLSARWEVSIATAHQYSRTRLQNIGATFGLDLSRVGLLTIDGSPVDCDVFIALANQVVPPLPVPPGAAGVCVCQFPFPASEAYIRARLRWLETYKRVIVYSEFVRDNYLKQAEAYNAPAVPVSVVWPPVEQARSAPVTAAGKLNRVLNIGRFFAGGHCKRQDLLIKAFRGLCELCSVKPELHLVGSMHIGAEHHAYITHCRELAEGLPVFFHLNADQAKVSELLNSSLVYWHGTGMGADGTMMPWALEHFGISIGEAMNAGCITMAPNRGGPTEIIEDRVTGYLFESELELVELTRAVFEGRHPEAVEEMRRKAIEAATRFSPEAFYQRWDQIIRELTPSSLPPELAGHRALA